MPPEQVHGAAADRRADIWAFGVVLYEMLTGKQEFTGESVSDVLASVLKFGPDWSALPGETPPVIRKLVRQCLTKDRKQRLQAIGDVRIAIEEELAAPSRDRETSELFRQEETTPSLKNPAQDSHWSCTGGRCCGLSVRRRRGWLGLRLVSGHCSSAGTGAVGSTPAESVLIEISSW